MSFFISIVMTENSLVVDDLRKFIEELSFDLPRANHILRLGLETGVSDDFKDDLDKYCRKMKEKGGVLYDFEAVEVDSRADFREESGKINLLIIKNKEGK